MKNKKNKPQSKLNKRNFFSVLIEPLKQRTYTRSELCSILGCRDVEAREEVRKVAMFYPVVSHSSKKGYYIVDVEKLINKGNVENIINEIGNLQASLNEDQSRIRALKRRMRAKIAAKKVLEKYLNEQ